MIKNPGKRRWIDSETPRDPEQFGITGYAR